MYLMIVVLFSPLFCPASAPSPADKEGVAHEGKTTQLVIPKNPLATGAVKFESIKPKEFVNWNSDDHLESFDLMQRVLLICKEKEVTGYLIYGGESTDSKSTFSWEIVPHPKGSWLLGKQLRVLWNIMFGAPSILKQEREQLAEHLRQELKLFPHNENEPSPCLHKDDVFCDQNVIKKEAIFEGKQINVLCSRYNPHDKVHFLLAPKNHRDGFSDLSESEYLEVMQLSQKIISFYKNKGYEEAHILHKTGATAGQIIPHWICQVILLPTKVQGFFSKLFLSKSLMMGSSPLSEEMFQHRVACFREELGEVLLGQG